MSIVLAWGGILFTPNKESFDDLSHKMNFGWQKQPMMNASPLYQATQELDYEITLKGKIYTLKAGHTDMINKLKAQGESQKPYFMADGNGKIYGKFILMSLDGTESHQLKNGIPLKQEYSLSLAHVSKMNGLFNLF